MLFKQPVTVLATYVQSTQVRLKCSEPLESFTGHAKVIKGQSIVVQTEKRTRSITRTAA
jgi:hypothetical protein